MEDPVGEAGVAVGGVPGVVQRPVQIRAPVSEGREEKSHLRRGHQPVRFPVVKLILVYKITQRRFGHLDRADAAQDAGVHLAACVVLTMAVLGVVGHIIAVAGEQDQIIALQIDGFDGAGKEFFPGRLVLQCRVSQGHEQGMFVPLVTRDLRGGKADIDQVFAQLPGEGTAQQRQELLRFLLPGQGQRLVKAGYDFPLLVYIAAHNMGNGALPLPVTAANLRDFFFVHMAWYPFVSLAETAFSIIAHSPVGEQKNCRRTGALCPGSYSFCRKYV